MSLCLVTQKICLLIPCNQKTQKNSITQKFKERVEIHYLCHHMPILVVAACPGLSRNLSPHRGSHWWKLSVVTTMEINQLDRGWPPYLPPVYALHLPNAVGPDLEPREEERPLWVSILEHARRKTCSICCWTWSSTLYLPYTHWVDVSCCSVV